MSAPTTQTPPPPGGAGAQQPPASARARLWEGRRLELNAAALMATTVLTAAVGLLYWAVAARSADATIVGLASAEVSAIMLVSALCQFNLANLFAAMLPKAGRHARTVVVRGYAATLSASLIAALGFVATPLPDAYLSGAASRALFVVAVVATTLFVVQDAVLTGLRRAVYLPVENVGASALRLAFVAGVGMVTLTPAEHVRAMVAAWLVPMIVASVVVNTYLFRVLLPAHVARHGEAGEIPAPAALARHAASETVNGLVANLVPLLLPLLVLHQLGAEANARFYLPLILNSALITITVNVATSFIVEATTFRDRADALLRRAARLAVAVGLAGAAGEALIGPFLLGMLGPEYAREGRVVLWVLAAGVPMNVVTVLFASICRVEQATVRLAVVQLTTGVAMVAGVHVLSGRYGLIGAPLGYVAAQVACALVVAPVVVRRLIRSKGNTHG